MKILHALHAVVTALLLIWAWWSFQVLGDYGTRLFRLDRTMYWVAEEVPAAKEAWCYYSIAPLDDEGRC